MNAPTKKNQGQKFKSEKAGHVGEAWTFLKRDVRSDVEEQWIEKYCHIVSAFIGLSTEAHLPTCKQTKCSISISRLMSEILVPTSTFCLKTLVQGLNFKTLTNT
jgi:hypothetical protein